SHVDSVRSWDERGDGGGARPPRRRPSRASSAGKSVSIERRAAKIEMPEMNPNSRMPWKSVSISTKKVVTTSRGTAFPRVAVFFRASHAALCPVSSLKRGHHGMSYATMRRDSGAAKALYRLHVRLDGDRKEAMQGKVIVITGATSGIGQVAAER